MTKPNDEQQLLACKECGHIHKASNNAKVPWSEKLCQIMGWSEDTAWKIRNGSMRADYLKQIVERLEQPSPRAGLSLETIAKAAYEQYMKNAKVEGKWEENLTKIGQEHWRLIAQAVIDAIAAQPKDDVKQ